MAQPTTILGSKFVIRLGDGQSPQAFSAPCALTAKSIAFSAQANEQNVDDCDDPDAPTWTARVVAALSAGISGSGTLALESFATWRTWFLSGAAKDVQVWLDEDTYGGYFSMSAVLAGFTPGANQRELATIEIDIQSNGEVTWTDGAPS